MRAPTPPLLPCARDNSHDRACSRSDAQAQSAAFLQAHFTTYADAHDADTDRVDLHVLDIRCKVAAHINAQQNADQVFAHNLWNVGNVMCA